jgi:hypothetical protein
MKSTLLLMALCFALFVSCAAPNREHAAVQGTKSETVLVTYHVKAGKEAELERILRQAWRVYTQSHLVYPEPHVLLKEKEGEGVFRYLETFTWMDRKTPEHAPAEVMELWKREEGLCEKRNGHYAIEPNEVTLVAP